MSFLLELKKSTTITDNFEKIRNISRIFLKYILKEFIYYKYCLARIIAHIVYDQNCKKIAQLSTFWWPVYKSDKNRRFIKKGNDVQNISQQEFQYYF